MNKYVKNALIALMLLVGVGSFFVGNFFSESTPPPALPEIEPDAYASSIFFTVNTNTDEMKVFAAVVVMHNEDVPKWKRQNFYVNPKASTVCFENGAYVFRLKSLDCTETLHGSIIEKAVSMSNSDSAGVHLCFQAHDVRLWDQVKHQPVRCTFDTCRVHVGNLAHTHTREF